MRRGIRRRASIDESKQDPSRQRHRRSGLEKSIMSTSVVELHDLTSIQSPFRQGHEHHAGQLLHTQPFEGMNRTIPLLPSLWIQRGLQRLIAPALALFTLLLCPFAPALLVQCSLNPGQLRLRAWRLQNPMVSKLPVLAGHIGIMKAVDMSQKSRACRGQNLRDRTPSSVLLASNAPLPVFSPHKASLARKCRLHIACFRPSST